MFEDVNENTIYEEELENIYTDLDHNFPSPTMNSGLMTVHHNDPDNFIDDPEYFPQYLSWILCEHDGTNIHKSPNQVSNAQLDWG